MKAKLWGKNRKMQKECYYCRRKMHYAEATVDHVKPKSKGGSNARGNLKLCCKKCNQQKGSLSVERFIRRAGLAAYVRVPVKATERDVLGGVDWRTIKPHRAL
jgi:5-methylcytosine-specific restriction endonuclease McrA